MRLPLAFLLSSTIAALANPYERAVQDLIDAVATEDLTKVESAYDRAALLQADDLFDYLATLPELNATTQFMASSLVAYSPHYEEAIKRFDSAKTAELRLCLIAAWVERNLPNHYPDPTPLPKKYEKALRKILKSSDPYLSARAATSLIAARQQKREAISLTLAIFPRILADKSNPDFNAYLVQSFADALINFSGKDYFQNDTPISEALEKYKSDLDRTKTTKD